MIINKMEDTILQSLFFDNEFYSKSFGFLSSNHFTDFSDSVIFKNIKQFVNEHSNTIGANGAGSALTNFFSSKFIGITSDGKNEISVICENYSSSI